MKLNFNTCQCVVFGLLILTTCSLQAQKELKIVTDELTDLGIGLSGTENKLEKATLTKEDERSIIISLRFKGFADKEYQLQVSALNSRKETIEDISKMVLDMPKSKQAEVPLMIKDPQKNMSQPTLNSKYLQVKVKPKGTGGISDVLDDAFDGLDLNTTTYLIELDKKWMLMGANVKIPVKLTAYMNAASISPN